MDWAEGLKRCARISRLFRIRRKKGLGAPTLRDIDRYMGRA
jgi:hypothetical protein